MSNKRTGLYKYAELILKAKLDCKAKALLWFYAYTYNWTDGRPSYWPERSICAVTGMSTSTYQVKRKYLEDLGWISVRRRGYKLPCKVWVLLGTDDPNYESKSWAKWHPSNKKSGSELDEFNEDQVPEITIETQLLDFKSEELKQDNLTLDDPNTKSEQIENIWRMFG